MCGRIKKKGQTKGGGDTSSERRHEQAGGRAAREEAAGVKWWISYLTLAGDPVSGSPSSSVEGWGGAQARPREAPAGSCC